MPTDLDTVTEYIEVSAGENSLNFLAIGPLVKAKFQSYGRGIEGDFVDLRFACTNQRYRAAVRQVAEEICLTKRRDFLRKILAREPKHAVAVCLALRLDPSPSPEDQSPQGRVSGGGGSGNNRNSQSGGSQSSSQSSTNHSAQGQGGGRTRAGGSGQAAGGHHDGGVARGTSTSGAPPSGGTAARTRSSGQLQARSTAGRTGDSLTSGMQRLNVSTPPVDPRASTQRSTPAIATQRVGTGGSSASRTTGNTRREVR